MQPQPTLFPMPRLPFGALVPIIGTRRMPAHMSRPGKDMPGYRVGKGCRRIGGCLCPKMAELSLMATDRDCCDDRIGNAMAHDIRRPMTGMPSGPSQPDAEMGDL